MSDFVYPNLDAVRKARVKLMKRMGALARKKDFIPARSDESIGIEVYDLTFLGNETARLIHDQAHRELEAEE